MTTDITLDLAKYIASSSHASHTYGENDCMTFPLAWHDRRFGTRQLKKIHKKYHSLATAYRFYRNFLSVEGWLRANGYKQVEDLANGDFVVQQVEHMPQVWIYLNSALYTVHEQRGLTAVRADLIDDYQIWRR